MSETVKASEKPNISNAILPRKAYSINEFCQIYGISRSFYYKLHCAGKIRPVQILGLVTITADEVERFAKEELV